VPHSIRKLLERKYADLTTEAQSLAAAAAVMDRHATVPVLRYVAGLPRRPLVIPIEELLRAGFIRNTPTAALALKHDLIRETVYGMLPQRLRRLLHARAAAVLKRRAPRPWSHHADLAGRVQARGFGGRGPHLRISAHSDALIG
jgi:predicted ATPase